jgi:integrative and conjugative element protein (TIGR02256 family)
MTGVHIAAAALASIAELAPASADDLETGGILLGYDADELGTALVMEAGDPGPHAERRRDFFRRDLAHAQWLADVAYERSCSRWIGEWHTHPQGALSPSWKDLRTYRRFLRDRELQFAVFVSLIVGPGETGWERPRLAAWLIELRRVLPALLLPSADQLELTIERPEHDVGAEGA